MKTIINNKEYGNWPVEEVLINANIIKKHINKLEKENELLHFRVNQLNEELRNLRNGIKKMKR